MAEKHVFRWEINTIYRDVIGTAICCIVYKSMARFLKKSYLKGLIDVYLYGKLFHIGTGLIVMLCWPIFSSSVRGRVIGSLMTGFFMRRPIIDGFGRPKVNETVKFLRKYKDSRVLFKGALSYVVGNAFAAIIHSTRTNLAIAIVSNLCVGDGVADILGRRLRVRKLPYNKNKSYGGSISMAIFSFLACLIFRYYFSWWGYVQESPNMVLGFLTVSIVSAVVESHPLSTTIEDNLTVPLASFLVGIFVL